MWPFSTFARRRHRKHYDAARFVYLGAWLFSRMDAAERARVEGVVGDLVHRGWYAKAAFDRYSAPDLRAFVRAAAMQHLGTPLPIAGVAWRDLQKPLRPTSYGWWRYYDFHRGSPPAMEALAWLASHGIDASMALQPEPDPRGPPPSLL